MRIAILQPGYLPWLGFFEQMTATDCFVYLNDVKYTHQDWRNRNRIKSADGISWLTVPVRKAPEGTLICDIEIADDRRWFERHLRKITHAYRSAPYFGEVFPTVSAVLRSAPRNLDALNFELNEALRALLGIKTPVVSSSDLDIGESDKNDRLIAICRRMRASVLYDGQAARSFIDIDRFSSAGIEVEFQGFAHPVYSQAWGEFVPYLSVIDLLMNHGAESRSIIESGGAHANRVAGGAMTV